MLVNLPSGLIQEYIYPYLNGKCAQQFYRTCKTDISSYVVTDSYIRVWNKRPLLKRVKWILKSQHRWKIHLISSLETPIIQQLSFAHCKENISAGQTVYINGLKHLKMWITVYDALGVILNESTPDSFVNTIHLNVYRKYHLGSSIIQTILPSLNKVMFQLHQPEIESEAHPWKG